jgi:hypothetical protein
MHARENVFALCFLFHFLLCKYWCHVCICFIHFCYVTSLLDNISFTLQYVFFIGVDSFIMKSCLTCSFIFFVSFHCLVLCVMVKYICLQHNSNIQLLVSCFCLLMFLFLMLTIDVATTKNV